VSIKCLCRGAEKANIAAIRQPKCGSAKCRTSKENTALDTAWSAPGGSYTEMMKPDGLQIPYTNTNATDVDMSCPRLANGQSYQYTFMYGA
jgi:hypothetical protein